MEDLAQRVAAYLEQHERSQAWLGKRVGVSGSVIWRIVHPEAKAHVSQAVIDRLEQFLVQESQTPVAVAEEAKVQEPLTAPKKTGRGTSRRDALPDETVRAIRRLYAEGMQPTEIKTQLELKQTPQTIGNIARGTSYQHVQ